ncbi:MAG: hypothetical protein P1U36_04925 [Legionellaceae bacterium]|nr:hypothetical protein [Legionellaceae bacterium]
MPSNTSSDYESDDELDQLNLIDANTGAYLYRALSDVLQDSYLTLEQAPEGMMSSNFATCFAVIMKDIKTGNTGLAHVSSITDTDDDVDFFNDMLQDVSDKPEDIVITLARSQQTYARHYQQRAGEQTADEYFAQYDRQYINFFRQHFSESTVSPDVLEMPHSCIVIDADGSIDLLEQHTSSSIKPEQFIPPSPVQELTSNPNTLMYSENHHEDESEVEEDIDDLSPPLKKRK